MELGVTNPVIQTIANIVSKSAPLLGSLIPIPGAAVVLELLSSAFGANSNEDLLSKMVADPEAAVKIAQIEAEHKVKLQELNNSLEESKLNAKTQVLQALVADRSSARDREIDLDKAGTRDYTQQFLILAIITAIIIIIVILGFGKIDSNEITILSVIATMLAREIKSIIDYYFGGSLDGDEDKN